MKMAKPSKNDIEAAESLAQLLNALDEDQRWGSAAIDGAPDFFTLIDNDEFDPEEKDHLQAIYNQLVTLMWKNPSFHNRVISGMCHVIMYDKNQIIDPDSDVIDLHPRFEETWKDLQRETQAARYWNKRYHQMVEENTKLRSIVSACADAVGAHCEKTTSLEFMNLVATEVYLFIDKLRSKYQREHIDTNRWKNRAELAEARIDAANAQAYAISVGAQQSPAVAAHGNSLYCGHNSLADMVSTHINVWRDLLESEAARNNRERPYLDHELNALSDIERAIKFDLENQSPRITEPAVSAPEAGYEVSILSRHGSDKFELQFCDRKGLHISEKILLNVDATVGIASAVKFYGLLEDSSKSEPSELVKEVSAPYPHPRISKEDAREIAYNFAVSMDPYRPINASFLANEWANGDGCSDTLNRINGTVNFTAT